MKISVVVNIREGMIEKILFGPRASTGSSRRRHVKRSFLNLRPTKLATCLNSIFCNYEDF